MAIRWRFGDWSIMNGRRKPFKSYNTLMQKAPETYGFRGFLVSLKPYSDFRITDSPYHIRVDAYCQVAQ